MTKFKLVAATASSIIAASVVLVSSAGPAQAQPATAVQKVLIDNEKVRVYEATFAPGAQGGNVARPYRIIRPLTDGTLQRFYPDGRTETFNWKAGEAREVGPDPQYYPKNIGTTELRLYIVEIKAK